ncbi:restriction endonuclease subunit S [Bifidobacterium adolescentis]|uniref:restriction endonuclease subunit S n=1 Tax=Bifidobacterium adolescentis TaxID=1680 RepID=UPI00321A5CAF
MAEQHGKTLVPQIRFAGFTDPWEQRKLGQHLKLSRELGHTGVDARKLTVKLWGKGVVEKTDLYGGSAQTQYYIRHAGQFMYGKLDFLHAAFGVVPDKLDCFESTLDSPAFDIEGLDSSFLLNLVTQEDFYLKNGNIANGSRKAKRIHEETFLNMEIRAPELVEQRQIGAFFDRLDSLITLHQRKYDKLCVLKKSMLDKMFPKGGSLYPEIRFAGFTDPWEQRKLSELVEIERGGSPRPIERYITDDPCGLNWVKIGDAPELGRYITQTTEKIKPEGLAKTRQVYPGDLVLSNSMSFGRPYIMAIKGCIHDGWLLIRDAQKHFDPIFLCHMLGAPQMLNQYRMFAAGSTVNNLNKELVGKAIVSLPSKDEQREIGIVLDRLDSLITLHQRKLELLRNIKKSMLDKMFV